MEIKNNPITLFLTNLLTFRFYFNRDPKSETEPFLSSNNPNDEPEEDPCENWVSSRIKTKEIIAFRFFEGGIL
ncbi:unnamed protein product [Rhizophagus irregularis]|uniref:Uncharacterized protein n=1 Tax=Rhizophagus irregularis TaxID=588596 RepID=A0A915YMR0_9GLOM|nr:unnamed protein product [Rhizophagus irregularis]